MAKKQQIEGAQFVRYFGPLLDALRTLGGSGTPSEVVEQIAADLKISDEAQADLLPSGTPRFPNQVAWARFYLAREGLLDAAKRGVWSLTDKGRSTSLSADQARALFLKWVRVFAEERKHRQDETPHPPEATPADGSPGAGGYREELLALLLSLPLTVSSGCLSAFFASPASCKWP
jgi:restriction system protein